MFGNKLSELYPFAENAALVYAPQPPFIAANELMEPIPAAAELMEPVETQGYNEDNTSQLVVCANPTPLTARNELVVGLT